MIIGLLDIQANENNTIFKILSHSRGAYMMHAQYTSYTSPFLKFTPYQAAAVNDSSSTAVTDYKQLGLEQPARWLSVDPLADKYPGWSPYNYCLNNPLCVVDPNGDTVRIADGNGGYLIYSAGMEYKGDNAFVAKAINALNNMNSVEIGAQVLGSLIASSNLFSFQNLPSAIGGTLQFRANSSGGGDILAAALMHGSETSNLRSTSHELFHGYQSENGGIFGSNSEVEAYLYSAGVATTFNQTEPGPMFIGNNSSAGKLYGDAMNDLLFNSFDLQTFNQAAENFVSGNPYGYRNNKYYPNYHPLISRFFPLVR